MDRYLQYDSLDDRREIFRLLNRLPPLKRLAWMRFACSRARMPKGRTQPRPAAKTVALAEQARWDSSASEKLTLDLYFDVWHLGVSFELDFDLVMNRLVEMVRRE